MNFYNEIDKYAAQWLRNLIAAGHIAPGVVDERSIADIDPDELRPFTQCHFFAGIGVWSHALRLAGWPDARPVWTGSCPCQPFSAAGKRGGHEDERHLWPAWQRLIRKCAPATVYGEQVASPDGLAWLDVVLSDLEDDHYAVAAANLCAAGVGAPHIRQRIYFVAHAERNAGRCEVEPSHHAWAQGDGSADRPGRCGGASGLVAHAGRIGRQSERFDMGAAQSGGGSASREQRLRHDAGPERNAGLVADTDGRNASAEGLQRSGQHRLEPQDGGTGRTVGDADDARLEGRQLESERAGERAVGAAGLAGELADTAAIGPPTGPRLARVDDGSVESQRPRDVGGMGDADGEREDALGGILGGPHAERPRGSFWSDADWIACRDGKARPVESKSFPLVDGSAFRMGSGSPLEGKSRVGMLRAYGNAIVAPVAAVFVRSSMEVRDAADV